MRLSNENRIKVIVTYEKLSHLHNPRNIISKLLPILREFDLIISDLGVRKLLKKYCQTGSVSNIISENVTNAKVNLNQLNQIETMLRLDHNIRAKELKSRIGIQASL